MIFAATQNPTCPRCGYDQSGAVATWTERCPVQGLCPECGTGFGWADVFDPSRQDIPWLVEHARSSRDAAGRTPRMIRKMSRPCRFWEGVGVLARVGLGTLAAWCAAIIGLLHMLTGTMLYRSEFVWASTWFPPGTGVTRGEIHAQALREAVLGSLIATERMNWAGATFWTALSGTSVTGIGAPTWAVAMVGFGAVWVLILTVVPVTRRAAKLRSAHIVRAALLAMLAPALVIEMNRAASALYVLWHGSPVLAPMSSGLGVVSGLLFVWSIVWWRAATKSGWGLHRQGPLVSLATLAGLLGAALATVVLRFDSVAWMLSRWT
jgi:hypothetical protein